MKTPANLLDELQIEEAVTTAVEVYKEAQQAINQYERVKEQARIFVRAYLIQNDQTRGRTDSGAFGITNPTPTYQVNEDKWQAACTNNSKLAAVQQQFDEARRALDMAQRDFLEEATPDPIVYIR